MPLTERSGHRNGFSCPTFFCSTWSSIGKTRTNTATHLWITGCHAPKAEFPNVYPSFTAIKSQFFLCCYCFSASAYDKSSLVSWRKVVASSLSVFWHLGSRAMSIHLTVLSLHFLVELLQEHMLQWAQVVLNSHPDLSYVDFLSKFRSFFNKA